MGFAADYSEIVEVFFFDVEMINANTYLDMMQLHAVPQIEHLQPHIILQQDSASPHWGLQVRVCLDRTFPGTWIGRDGPMPWPPISPDITPLDFFLWGYVKSNVFRTPVNGPYPDIPADMLHRTWQELEYHLDAIHATKGAHIELY
jgi:hypothetical protein